MYKCEEHGYTLEESCKFCNEKTTKISVPKFSLKKEDQNVEAKEDS